MQNFDPLQISGQFDQMEVRRLETVSFKLCLGFKETFLIDFHYWYICYVSFIVSAPWHLRLLPLPTPRLLTTVDGMMMDG